MIVYGIRSKESAKEILTEKCPNCGAANSVDMYVFQKYAHIFWIPFFPVGKTGVSQCSHCRQMLKKKAMPPVLSAAYDNIKQHLKTPLWMFSGLALVVALVVTGLIADKNKDEKNAKLILSPQRGDVFEIKTTANRYTLYKVDAVRDDSAFLLINNYETDKIAGLRDLEQKFDTSFSEETYSFSKGELKKMLEKGEIIDIDRR